MLITTQNLLDGVKNCAVKITGSDLSFPFPWTLVVDLVRFKKPRPRTVKIDHIEWAVTDKIEVFLAWQGNEDAGRELIVPLGGRGNLKLDDYGGLSNQGERRSGNIEIYAQLIETPRSGEVSSFVVFLDLIKQE